MAVEVGGKKMKRGRKCPVDRVYASLKECLEKSNTNSGFPYRCVIEGKELFIWTTSSANAVRICAYYLGAHATPISSQEIVKVLRKSE